MREVGPIRLLIADRVITGDGSTVIPAGAVAIDDRGRIIAAGPAAAIEARPDLRGAAAVRYPGATILPGLIDLHVHVGYWYSKPDERLFDGNEALIALFAASDLREALSLGVTTIREMTNTGGLSPTLNRAAERGYIVSPRLFFSNRMICITGGHSWQLEDGTREADGPWDVRKAVREQIKTGADWIKLANSGNFQVEYTREELEAAVDEAHRLGRKVAVHAGSAQSIHDCVLAGVDTIEHGTHLTVADAELMARNGIAWVPTMVVYFWLAEHQRRQVKEAAEEGRLTEAMSDRNRRLEEAEKALRTNFRSILETGVTIATGTDMVPDREAMTPVADEMTIFTELGMTPLEAIRAATQTGARVLGREGEFGTIAAGLAADILVVDGDPSTDIAATRKVRAVYRDGSLVYDSAIGAALVPQSNINRAR